ncbi:MAG: ankyrin repeat domain-containing protein [Planctomycetota bacterium]
MKRILKILIVAVPVLILVHDAGSGRFSVFRDQFDQNDVNDQLVMALNARNADAVRCALHRGADPDFGGIFLWFGVAIVARYNSLVPKDTGIHRANVLHYSVCFGDAEIAGILLDWGAYISRKDDTYGRTALHFAVIGDDVHSAKLLLERGADVNARANSGETPLDLARSREMHFFLHKHGAKTGKKLAEETKSWNQK